MRGEVQSQEYWSLPPSANSTATGFGMGGRRSISAQERVSWNKETVGWWKGGILSVLKVVKVEH
jgi:hypothetical protein